MSKDPPRPGRYTRLLLSMGRHPADLVRIAIASSVVLACLVAVGDPVVNPVEVAIFSELQLLPAWSAGFWHVLTWAGSWPGILLATGLALYLGRIRLATAVAGAGAASWLLAMLIGWLTAPRPVPPSLLHSIVRVPASGAFGFPDARVAVVAALASAAQPYLSRSSRNAAWLLLVLAAVAEVFLGRNLPLGVFAGAVLGWGVGALCHVVLGAPGRATSHDAIRVALHQAGLDPVRIADLPRRLMRPQEFEVLTAAGDRLQMKVVRRLHRLAGPGYKLRRAAASLAVEREPGLSTPRHEVDHEAYITLLAERAGVGVIPVLLAGEIDLGPPFLIRRHIEGRRLSVLAQDEVHDALLDAIWHDVSALGAEHIVHHDLRASSILVDAAGRPRITDFTLSTAGGHAGQGVQDVAEMLVSITSVVGVRRAVDSAIRSLSTATLRDCLPHLQWLALQRRHRGQCDNAKVTLADLRETLAGRLDVPVPSFRSPVRPATVAMMVAGGAAVYLLLPQLSSMRAVLTSLAHADRRWLSVAVITGLLTILAETWAVRGSSPTKLPFGKTLAVQVAATFTGRTTAAGVGFYGVNLVFLERLGLRRSRAVGVLLLNRVAMGVVGAVGTGVGILVIGSAVPVGELAVPTSLPFLVAAAVVVATAVSVLISPFGRRRLWHPAVKAVRDLARDMLPVLRQPLRATELLGGSVLFLALSALGLAATLTAFRTSFAILPVLAVFVVGSTIGQIAPTPGGLGAVEAALVGGLTAIGIPSTEAVAAVLASRVLTFWLPVVPGIVAFRLLQRRGIV